MHRALLTLTLACLPLACDDPEPEPFLGDDEFVRDPALDIELVSAHGDDRSHADGDNCMRCHQENGPGPGRFTAAGTVYDADGAPAPDSLVELRTAPDGMGDLVLALEADARGNFYSTEPLPFPDTALFPTVYSDDGARKNHMPWPTRSGACNLCHAGGAVVRLPEG